MSVEHIRDGEILCAVIIRASEERATEFFSPHDFPLQVGQIVKRAGDRIPPHLHTPPPVPITSTQEFLYLMKGRVEVDLYSNDREPFATRMLNAGDATLIACGGHGFTIHEDSIFFEVKQGPYPGDGQGKILVDTSNDSSE